MARSETATWRPWFLLLGVLGLRYLCHGIALLLVLPHELQPAVPLPDLLLRHIPYVAALARWNYVLWILCYVPPALWIGWRDRGLFIRLVLTDGALAVLRGLTIPLIGIGPVLGPDLNALHPFAVWPAWLALINPFRAIFANSAGVYLTKDLFFSGHIATTFLLYLFSRRFGKPSRAFLALNLFTLAVVFLSHLHYTVDVIAAYAITYGVYRASERLATGQARSRAPEAPSPKPVGKA